VSTKLNHWSLIKRVNIFISKDPNENLPRLYRAAEISLLDIGKCSIGPKSTLENIEKEK